MYRRVVSHSHKPHLSMLQPSSHSGKNITHKQAVYRQKYPNCHTRSLWRCYLSVLWIHALHTSFCIALLRTLKHPGNDPPESPPNTYFPQTNSSPPASPRDPPSPATPPYHAPPRSQPPSPHQGTENFDKSGIGYNLCDSLGVFGLEMEATVREVKFDTER